MRVLLYGLNYAPEVTGVGKYSGEAGAWLANRGHAVQVVTALPYYPEWRIHPDYHKMRYCVETGKGGETIRRCPLYVPAIANGPRRIIHLFSFALSSIPMLLRLVLWKPDVIFVVEPTLFCVPIALWLSRMLDVPCWMHIQDFEVDAAFGMGLLPSGGFVQRFAQWTQDSLIRSCSRVSSISQKMVERIWQKDVPAQRTSLFPNWVDTEAVKPGAGPGRYREELGLANRIVVLYSGNLGNKQGLEIVGPLCKALQPHPEVHLLVCGEGSLRPHLEMLAARHSNLTLLPLQPLERLGELLCTADIHLLPQRPGMADLVMPSKLAGIMASERPVITTALPDTQVACIVVGSPEQPETAAGLIVPPDDAEALRDAVLELAANPQWRLQMGMAARKFALEHMTKEAILMRFERDLRELVFTAEERSGGETNA